VIGMMGLLPSALQGPAIEMFSRKGSLVASNVPGPQAPLYMCGQQISEMYFWVPQSGSMGIGVSILSYAGKVFFGMIADRALIADPQTVVDRFKPEFERLLLAVTVGALALHEHPAPRGQARPGRPAGTARKTRKAARPALKRKRSPRKST
jgi:diacylglycerol O-acyltransferase